MTPNLVPRFSVGENPSLVNKRNFGRFMTRLYLIDSTQCQRDRIMARDPRLRLEFLPRCNANGAYHVIQCSIHLDTCWCVDQSGHKIADAVDGRNGKHCGEKPRGKTLSSCGICLPLPSA